MKKLLFAFAAAAMMVACGNNNSDNAVEESASEQQAVKGGDLKIAFVLIDTLTSQYELYKEASDAFQRAAGHRSPSGSSLSVPSGRICKGTAVAYRHHSELHEVIRKRERLRLHPLQIIWYRQRPLWQS